MAWLTDEPGVGAEPGAALAAAPPEPQALPSSQPPVVVASYTPRAAQAAAPFAQATVPGGMPATSVAAAADKHGTTQFEGRAASRLDDVIISYHVVLFQVIISCYITYSITHHSTSHILLYIIVYCIILHHSI